MVVLSTLQIGGKRVEAAAQKGNTYSLSLLFGKNKAAWDYHTAETSVNTS